MKKAIRRIVAAYGCSAHYSGSRRIMFIRGKCNKDVLLFVLAEVYPTFNVVAQ